MKVMLLINSHGFSPDDNTHLTSLGYEGYLRPGKDLFHLGLSNPDIPTLFFPDTRTEQGFFTQVMQKRTLLVFTTLPAQELLCFHGKQFSDNANTILIRSDLEQNQPNLHMYAPRLIRFTFVSTQPVDLYMGSLVKTGLPEKEAGIYAGYIDPVILEDVPEARAAGFFTNFFERQIDLPIALPGAPPHGEDSYFGQTAASTRELLRTSFRSEGRTTLFVALWQMTDTPVFREYLREGATFSIGSCSFDTPGLKSISSDGGTGLVFNYPRDNHSYLSRWRACLLDKTEGDAPPIADIKQAFIRDITSACKGIQVLIKKHDNNQIMTDWSKIMPASFDEQYPRTKEGAWYDIQQFQGKIPYVPGQQFVKDKVLDPSRSQGATNPDHHLALSLFSDYLCKCPFSEPPLIKVWQSVLLNFIRNTEQLNPKEIDPGLVEENGFFYYVKPLTVLEVFKLRLMLPADAILKARSSNILDHPNTILDNKLMLS
jgi:hypothetical protein